MTSGGVEPRECEWPDCGMCEDARKRGEAELGLRCADCLEEFGRRPWIHPDEDEPTRCPSCQRLAVYRSTAPTSPGRYGTAGPA